MPLDRGCACMNGGRCKSDAGIARCECPFGYEGHRCENPAFELVAIDQNKPDSQAHLSVVFIALFLTFMTLGLCFFLWRKYLSLKKKEEHQIIKKYIKTCITNQKRDSRSEEMLLTDSNLKSSTASNGSSNRRLNIEKNKNCLEKEELGQVLPQTYMTLMNNKMSYSGLLTSELKLLSDIELPRRKRRSGISR